MRQFAFLTFLFAAACGSPPPPPLTNAFASPDLLARAVLLALSRLDETTLRSIAITEQEFRVHIWPDLPASRPERNLPSEYVWGELRQKSDANLQAAVAKYRGHRFELTGVRFDGALTNYKRSRVHRKAVFLVRGPGGPAALRVCGSLIEKDGAWKVFSYIVDE